MRCVVCKREITGEFFQAGPRRVMCKRCIENRNGVSMKQFIHGPWPDVPDYRVLSFLTTEVDREVHTDEDDKGDEETVGEMA